MADRPTSSPPSPCIAVPCQPATACPAGVMRTEDGTALDGGRIAIHRRCILKSVEHERHCTVAQLLSGRQYSRHGETLGSDVACGAGAARRSVAHSRTWGSTLPAVMAAAGRSPSARLAPLQQQSPLEDK